MPLIDLTSLGSVVFDGKEVQVLQLNGNTIWELETDDLSFNYTGLDTNGNMEGQLAFDGTIVAYAVGKPVITITTADDGTQSETIEYERLNGFNSEYYGGYNFQNRLSAPLGELTLDEQIIKPDVIIPNTYKNKPITTVLDAAFGGYYSSEDGYGNEAVNPQGSYIKNIVIGENVLKIGVGAFRGAGKKPHKYVSTVNSIKFNDKINTIERVAFENAMYDEYNLPTQLQNLGYSAFHNTYTDTKVVVNSNLTYLSANISGTVYHGGLYAEVKTVIFERNVTKLSGYLLYDTQSIQAKWIFKHSNSDEIIINIDSPKNAVSVDIYTDNDYIRNYDWASKNYTVNFYPLSDYVE